MFYEINVNNSILIYITNILNWSGMWPFKVVNWICSHWKYVKFSCKQHQSAWRYQLAWQLYIKDNVNEHYKEYDRDTTTHLRNSFKEMWLTITNSRWQIEQDIPVSKANPMQFKRNIKEKIRTLNQLLK